MIITVKNRTALTVPFAVQHQAGFKTGDVVELKVSGGAITIVPKRPTAGEEYTAEQLRRIDAQLDEAERGPFHGPFDTADETIAHINSELKKRASLAP
jgi:antitoxin component of MazEF toxin-antitoxin module